MTYNLNGKKSIGTDAGIREMVESADKHFNNCYKYARGIVETHENERNQCYEKNQRNILVLSNILSRMKTLLDKKSRELNTAE